MEEKPSLSSEDKPSFMRRKSTGVDIEGIARSKYGRECPIEIWEGIPVYKKEDTRSRYGREYPFIRGKGNVRSEYGRKMPDQNMGRNARSKYGKAKEDL
jgi:hypothetical protein